MINVYNTLSREKEEFRPIEDGKVGMYVCGPTVYDVPHIGHARSAYIFDFIRRYLEYVGYDVRFVRNVTDVDDKIINKARQELDEIGENAYAMRLKERVREVAERYLEIYHRELDIFGIRHPSEEPHATDYISEMIEFIEGLIGGEYAYEAKGNVYFSVEAFAEYGKLSKQDTGQIMHGVRVDVEETKRHRLDFALWKNSKPGEPAWPSPWGDGRPGWHIECSVMSTRILGNRFDIHGGGLDLIFPHHENEIAQAEACTGETFANYWIHNGLLTVGTEKMSKSLGNYVTIENYLKKHADPDLLKISFLNSHYRSPMDYTDEKMNDARRSKERIMIFMDRADRMMTECSEEDRAGSTAPEMLEKAQWEVTGLREKFEEAMNDDFNTPAALSVIFESVRAGNDYLSAEGVPRSEKAHRAMALKNFILRSGDTLGLSLRPIEMDDAFTAEIDRLVGEREKARKGKDYAAADKLRDELTERGVVVEDTAEGPIWRKN